MIRRIRFSIAGLMVVVLFAAVGMAAWSDPTESLDGVVFLLTCGVLTLAVVGVVCGAQGERAWWLGFALFGWGYLALAFSAPHQVLPRLPTSALLKAVAPDMVEPRGEPSGGGFRSIAPVLFFGGFAIPTSFELSQWRIGQCLWTLAVAVLGGTLARFLFAVPPDRREEPVADPRPTSSAARRLRRWFALIMVAGLGPTAALALVGLTKEPGLYAAVVFLGTWAAIGLAALVAVYGRGQRRARWLAAALFGAGTMIMIGGPGVDWEPAPRIAANAFVSALRAGLPAAVNAFPASSKDAAIGTARIMEALERSIPMRFPNDTALADVMTYILQQTKGADGRPIAIYVDPVGVNEPSKAPEPPVRIDVVGVPLKVSLARVLEQRGLTYRVREGILIVLAVDADESLPADDDPFLLVGNSVLALLAAGLGGLLGPLVAGRDPVDNGHSDIAPRKAP